MEDLKPMEIDLKHYMRRYLEDEFLADMEYKDHLVVVRIDKPVVKKKKNNIYFIEPEDVICENIRPSEKRDREACLTDSYFYVPRFYLKESEYYKLNNLPKKIEIRGIASSFDKTTVVKTSRYKTVSRWFKKVEIKFADYFEFEFPFKDCTITPVIQTLSFEEFLDIRFSTKGYTLRFSIVIADIDTYEGSYIVTKKKTYEDDPDDDRYDKVTFKFGSVEEQNKVKKLNIGETVVIEGVCGDYGEEVNNCHLIDKSE